MIKKILALIVLVGAAGLLGTSFLGSFLGGGPSTTGSPSEEGLGYNSAVCIDALLNGEPVHVGCSHNVLTEFGKNATKAGLTGGESGNFSFIALCNATNNSATGDCAQPASTDTELGNEYGLDANTACGLGRASGTLAHLGAGNWSYVYTFTSTCANVVTNITGIFNNSATNGRATMFAGNNFTSVTLQASDTLQITWYIWVT